jgi:hypothetical protein
MECYYCSLHMPTSVLRVGNKHQSLVSVCIMYLFATYNDLYYICCKYFICCMKQIFIFSFTILTENIFLGVSTCISYKLLQYIIKEYVVLYIIHTKLNYCLWYWSSHNIKCSHLTPQSTLQKLHCVELLSLFSEIVFCFLKEISKN